jgi:hypothetical protein
MRSHHLVFAVALLAGCNAIAGIGDYRTVDAFGGGGAATGGADAGSGGAPLPTCSGPEVGLRITVVESVSGQFSGISDQGGLFTFLGVGKTFSSCVPSPTVLDLRAEPNDPSTGKHDWGACGVGRRCNMTVDAPTALDVHLQ